MFVASAMLRPSKQAAPRLARQIDAARSVYCKASAQVDRRLQHVSVHGKPVEFAWSLGSSQGLSQDARRYESELRYLFNSDDEEWSDHPVVCTSSFFLSLPCFVTRVVVGCTAAVHR